MADTEPMFHILHISDLHRSLTEPFNNDALVAALLADHARYALDTPPVPRIDAIIVSGDEIQGIPLRPDATDSAVWTDELSRQYEVAYDFVSRLADRFLGGDRSQVIIVPGNHDICWNTAYRSMARVTLDELKGGVWSALAAPDSRFRWSWSELAPYKIVDLGRYEQRLDSYWSFVDRFYHGVQLIRPIDRTKGYNLFEIDQGRILVAAFDSIAGNDCFEFGGDFRRDAVAKCAIELHDLGKAHDLRMAVWHHNVEGPPQRSDYMDVSRVRELIGHGFRLGLHGHQHVSSAEAQYIHLPESQAMAVVSAGSLCAGSRELPRGVDRQYNLVSLNAQRTSARVIVRQMGEGGHFARKSDGRFAADGSVTLEWERPLDPGGRSVDPPRVRLRQNVERAERLRAAGDLKFALDVLEGLDLPPGSYERKLALSIAVDADRHDRILEVIDEPADEAELIHYVIAALRERRLDLADSAMNGAAAGSIAANLRTDLEGRIVTYRALNP